MKNFGAIRIEGKSRVETRDALALEAPLHLKVNGVSYTTTMRTPGADRVLARGLLFTEAIVPEQPSTISFSEVLDPETGFIACLDAAVPSAEVLKDVEGLRTQLSASSCGVCGTRDPAQFDISGPAIEGEGPGDLDSAKVGGMFEEMREAQREFDVTGGVHGAAAFPSKGAALAIHEDIGRHNAVDKVVGAMLESGNLSSALYLLVSGRVSYEIVYKAYRARIPFLLAVSAPSSMAVETADRMGITLAAFCRDGRFTIYTHSERLGAILSEEA